jgi:hypothetical protein
MKEIRRVEKISKEEFLQNNIIGNFPIIITDAMSDWDLSRFQPASLKKEFGSEFTQVYDDLFDLQNVASLESYLDANFNKPNIDCKNYARWYTKLKDVDFLWSDDVFDSLKDAWSHPYFLPQDSLLVPLLEEGKEKSITAYRFPYKGLFISGKGSRTRLHKDPFHSNAVLCQLYGKKDITLYAPDQEQYVMNADEFVNIINPDLNKFPKFPSAKVHTKVTLSAGEIILFPAGWFHDVTCVTDSISITWNFVHASALEELTNHLRKNPNDSEIEILRFFLGDQISSTATVNEIIAILEKSVVKKTV